MNVYTRKETFPTFFQLNLRQKYIYTPLPKSILTSRKIFESFFEIVIAIQFLIVQKPVESDKFFKIGERKSTLTIFCAE